MLAAANNTLKPMASALAWGPVAYRPRPVLILQTGNSAFHPSE